MSTPETPAHIPSVVIGDDRAINQQGNWGAYSTQQLYDAVHQNGDVTAVANIAQQWSSLGDRIDQQSNDLAKRVNDTDAGWQGEAATAAREALSKLVSWGHYASDSARIVGGQLARQAEILQTAQAAMPAPVEVDPNKIIAAHFAADPTPSGLSSGVADARAQLDHAASVHQQAVDVMNTMEASSREVDAKVPVFLPPPTIGKTSRQAQASAPTSGAPGTPGGAQAATGPLAPRTAAVGADQPGSDQSVPAGSTPGLSTRQQFTAPTDSSVTGAGVPGVPGADIPPGTGGPGGPATTPSLASVPSFAMPDGSGGPGSGAPDLSSLTPRQFTAPSADSPGDLGGGFNPAAFSMGGPGGSGNRSGTGFDSTRLSTFTGGPTSGVLPDMGGFGGGTGGAGSRGGTPRIPPPPQFDFPTFGGTPGGATGGGGFTDPTSSQRISGDLFGGKSVDPTALEKELGGAGRPGGSFDLGSLEKELGGGGGGLGGGGLGGAGGGGLGGGRGMGGLGGGGLPSELTRGAASGIGEPGLGGEPGLPGSGTSGAIPEEQLLAEGAEGRMSGVIEPTGAPGQPGMSPGMGGGARRGEQDKEHKSAGYLEGSGDLFVVEGADRLPPAVIGDRSKARQTPPAGGQ